MLEWYFVKRFARQLLYLQVLRRSLGRVKPRYNLTSISTRLSFLSPPCCSPPATSLTQINGGFHPWTMDTKTKMVYRVTVLWNGSNLTPSLKINRYPSKVNGWLKKSFWSHKPSACENLKLKRQLAVTVSHLIFLINLKKKKSAAIFMLWTRSKSELWNSGEKRGSQLPQNGSRKKIENFMIHSPRFHLISRQLARIAMSGYEAQHILEMTSHIFDDIVSEIHFSGSFQFATILVVPFILYTWVVFAITFDVATSPADGWRGCPWGLINGLTKIYFHQHRAPRVTRVLLLSQGRHAKSRPNETSRSMLRTAQ